MSYICRNERMKDDSNHTTCVELICKFRTEFKVPRSMSGGNSVSYDEMENPITDNS